MSMTLNVEREKVKEKVAKFLNMTVDRGASESEARTAAEKAAELMAHFDIHISELSLKSAKAIQQEVLFKKYGRRKLARDNARHIAKLCDCLYWWNQESMVFFGLPHEAEIAAHLFATIANCIAAEIDKYRNSGAIEAEKEKSNFYVTARTLIGDFIEGLETRLSERLSELNGEKIQAVQEATAGNSLVPLKMEQIQEDFEASGIKLRKGYTSWRAISSVAAYRSGAAAGDRIPLSRGINSARGRELLK
jgi:hypothetical protein